MIISFNENEEELLKSVLSILKNGTVITQISDDIIPQNITYPGICVDVSRRRVTCNEQEVQLTYSEFEILTLLLNHPGRVFSKEQIYDWVWREPYAGDYNIVMSHISHIREKIEADPKHPVYIQTVWGVGYRFNNKIT